ncbi:hypothetical protein N7645_14330 [Pseudomonas juntendi]|uniref:hypothetical protein n=1 Tax=Pseudomonas juntendi TaxID=2666183 RepID=UPI00244BB073|nr:hypothetical protein [Pseudomonas juntendi]MDG9918497.1 hypothetical protein [Pseudomonas juntendi]MDH0507510.1 hypothetical protein [Pseudomonas juntendi]MDH1044696.1 hypothetical protein [Pseudomonas juntendi]
MKAKQAPYKSLVSGPRTSSKFDSTIYFKDVELVDSSPISRFISQREILTRILGREDDSEEWRTKASLAIIGIVSGVESYFRSIIRRVLITDEDSRAHSYRNKVSYGAVLFHLSHLLPEALLEDSTFVSKETILKNIKNFLGLSINPQQIPALDSALDEFEKVCHLRHCIAHRSGLLGSKNAIELGLDKFSIYLEKPISPTLDSVNNVFNICQNLALEFNDQIFDCIITRSIPKGIWTGDLRRDKKIYSSLFAIFSPTPTDMDELKKSYRSFTGHFGI